MARTQWLTQGTQRSKRTETSAAYLYDINWNTAKWGCAPCLAFGCRIAGQVRQQDVHNRWRQSVSEVHHLQYQLIGYNLMGRCEVIRLGLENGASVVCFTVCALVGDRSAIVRNKINCGTPDVAADYIHMVVSRGLITLVSTAPLHECCMRESNTTS